MFATVAHQVALPAPVTVGNIVKSTCGLAAIDGIGVESNQMRIVLGAM